MRQIRKKASCADPTAQQSQTQPIKHRYLTLIKGPKYSDRGTLSVESEEGNVHMQYNNRDSGEGFIDVSDARREPGTELRCLYSILRQVGDEKQRFAVAGSDIHDIIGWVQKDEKYANDHKIIVFDTYGIPFSSHIFPGSEDMTASGKSQMKNVIYSLEMITLELSRYIF